MKIHNVQQGSVEWHNLRGSHYTASEAPAMMGVSKYMSRSELLKQDAIGIIPEVDAATQRRFNNGHAAEAGAREIAEEIIGQNLFPATVSEEVDGLPLLASLDGMTLDGEILWEHKLWNEELAQQVRDGNLHPMYLWQMCQQMLVTGAKKTLFMCSDGTREKCVWLWAEPKKGEDKKLIAGWKQYREDLMNYVPEEVAPVVNGNSPDSLPALRIQVQGMVTDSNLDQFKETALAVIGRISTDLQTDQDFADAEKSVKWCKDVEGSLDAAKQHALSQTETIDRLFRAIDEIREKTRSTRLTLEKLVKSRKDEIRASEVARGIREYREFVKGLAVGMDFNLQGIVPDPQFGNAIKGLKTVKSLKDKIDSEVANLKIEATEIVTKVRSNLELLRKLSKGYESLVYDTTTLVLKEPEDMTAIVQNRIRDAKEREDVARQSVKQIENVNESLEQVHKEYNRVRRAPTLDEILLVLTQHYHADRETVLGWLTDVLDALETEN
jgi:putative phage-type endonuclease